MPSDVVDSNPLPAAKSKKPVKKKVIADSWDDDASDDGDDTGLASDLRDPPVASPAGPPAPPAPTPGLSTPFLGDLNNGAPGEPSYYSYDPETHSRAGGYSGGEMGGFEAKRQAKTDAVARRMIASALGVRSRSTKEQKEYENSLKKKAQEERDEKKRLEQEREKARAAMWED